MYLVSLKLGLPRVCMNRPSIRESDPKELNNKILTKRTISLFEELSDQRLHIKGVFELFKGFQNLVDLNKEIIETVEEQCEIRFSQLETRCEAIEARCESLETENTSLKARLSFLELEHHAERSYVSNPFRLQGSGDGDSAAPGPSVSGND